MVFKQFYLTDKSSYSPRYWFICFKVKQELPVFVLWHPEPRCFVVNACNISLSNFQSCASSPFCLLPRVLAQVQTGSVNNFRLIAPIWPTQNWYPPELEVVPSAPSQSTAPFFYLKWTACCVFLTAISYIPWERNHHAAWILSADSLKGEPFLKSTKTWCVFPHLKRNIEAGQTCWAKMVQLVF